MIEQIGVRDQAMHRTKSLMTPVPKMKLWRAAEIVSAIETGAVFQANNRAGQRIRFSIVSCDAVREVANVTLTESLTVPPLGTKESDEVSYDAILFAEAGWPKFIEISRKPS